MGYRYLVRSDTGQVLAVSAEVIYYVHGGEGTQPGGLSSRLQGRRDGETFTTTLDSDQAFGTAASTRRLTLPPERFPQLLTLEPGTHIEAASPEGERVEVWVEDTTEEEVTLDFDHPLAGRRLHFEVSILSIRLATNDEMEQGQPAAPRRAPAGTEEAQLERAVNELERASYDVPADLQGQLLDLRQMLRQRLSDNERAVPRDGAATRYGTEQRRAELQRSHESLLSRLDSLVGKLERIDGQYDPRPALTSLVAALDQHEDDASAQVQESLQTDVGGEG